MPFLRVCAVPRPSAAVSWPPIVRTAAVVLALTPGSPAGAIDLLEAYQAALANDAQLASARAQLAATRELVPQARAGLLPRVSAGGSLDQQWADSNVAATRDFLGQSYGVQLSYPLYRMQNLELLEQSRLQVALGEAQYREVQQQLIVRVAQAYFDVLSALDSLETIEAQKRAIAEQLASAKRNFEVGTATITDQQEAQARYDLTLAQEFAAVSELEIRRAALEQLVGQPIGELEALRPGLDLEGPQPARESEWVESARRDSYPVQQAALASEVARREIDLQRYARFPTVDLTSSVAHTRNSQANFVGVRSNSAVIGLEVAIPLYTGGGISARVRQAVASHERALADLETARRAAEQGARQSFLGVTSGLAQVRALEAAERSSQLALESNLLGYQVGVRINIDVLNAQQQLFTTRRDLARARYDVLVNGLRLQETAGTLDDEDLRKVDALLMPPAALPAQPAPAIRPAPSRPGVPQPFVLQPGVPQPGVPQPGVPQPGVPQPRVPQPGVPQPGVPQPGVPQQGAPQPGVPGSPEPQVPPSVPPGSRSPRPALPARETADRAAPARSASSVLPTIPAPAALAPARGAASPAPSARRAKPRADSGALRLAASAEASRRKTGARPTAGGSRERVLKRRRAGSR